MDNIIFDDEYVKALAEYFTKQGNRIEKCLEEYIDILNDIIKNEMSEGATSEALKVYTDVAKALQGMASKTSTLGNMLCTEFVSDIEKADKF